MNATDDDAAAHGKAHAATDPPEWAAPLLSEESLRLLETAAWASRWPAQDLQILILKVCRAERGVHEATVAGDPDRLRTAEWKRAEARSALRAEQESLAETAMCLLSHAVEYRGAEFADLVERAAAKNPEVATDILKRLLGVPGVSAVLVPLIETLMGPSVVWLRREQNELRDEQADQSERLENVEDLLVQRGGVS